jgi:hypothetical protein
MLVSSVAFGLGLSRETAWDLYASLNKNKITGTSSLIMRTGQLIYMYYDIVYYMLLCLSICFVLIRLRSPRVSYRRVMTQPGAVACWTSTLVFLISMTPPLVCNLFKVSAEADFLSNLRRCATINEDLTCIVLGYAVAASWVVLALSGQWCPEAGWIDRGGKTIGVIWILSCIIYNIYFYA